MLFVKMSRMLERRSIASMRFDFRGSGESDGEFKDVTVSGEISDALAALKALRRTPRVDGERIGVIGLSLGGCVAACLAGRRSGVKSLVLWSAVAELGMIPQHMLTPHNRRRFQRHGFIDIGGLALGRAFFEDLPSVDPLKEIARSRAAVLVVHGEKDEVVPPKHAGLYERAAVNACELERIIIKGGDHVFRTVRLEEKVMSLTADWFVRTL